MSGWTIIFVFITFGLILNIVLAGFVVFFERRNPASTWAWLLVLFFMPLFGFLIYMVVGRNSKREKMFQEKEKYDRETYISYLLKNKTSYEKIQAQSDVIENGGRLIGADYLTDLAYLHLNSGNWITFNNEVEYFNEGQDKFEALVRDIRAAKEYIHMEYYIWRGDKLGRRLVEELTKKAEEGVEVRLLYDGIGNRTLPKNFFDRLHRAGGYTAAFLPRLIVRLNYRDHRKLCVIDGKVGYIGGFNVGEEYLGIVKRYGHWRDMHLSIQGDAVDQLQIRFVMDWNFTAQKGAVPLRPKYFPERVQKDGVRMQIVSSGPDTQWKNVRNGYFKMINEAEKSIYVTTPYFVPDDAILEGLKVAALSGIDTRIIIPGNPDHPFVYWASVSYLGELLQAGVRCYQYKNGFTHSKMILIDSLMASVGTANMDIRSFDLNFEVNAFIYDAKLTKQLEESYFADLQDCEEITMEWYRSRRGGFKIKEALARLLSPML